MTVALSAAVVVLAVLVFLLLGALVEMYRDIAQLREHSGLIDKPLAFEIPGALDAKPSAYGLPPALDATDRGVVLFLSDKCGTCRSIAASLDGQVPGDLWLVLDPANPRGTPDLAKGYNLGGDRVTVDRQREISLALGVTVTPAAIVINDGRIERGTTVPSSRQLRTLLRNLRSANQETPAESVELPLIRVSTGKDHA